MGKYIGNLSGPRQKAPACPHECARCGKDGTELLFSMTRDAVIQITRDGKSENYRVQGVGGDVIHADLAEGSEQIPLPPPPPQVWLVYKHGGAYTGDALQGIYSSEEGAKDSVRFAVKAERASLARRLGQPQTPHEDEEPPLTWQPGHHWRYGPIAGEYHAEAGLANFTVKSYQVPAGYLPKTTWCKVPHVTAED